MKKMIWIILLLSLIIMGVYLYSDYKNTSGIRFVNSMGVGINIGNTLDSTRIHKRKVVPTIEYYETYWNNPLITKDLIFMIKEAGFGTVRIPVTWDEHMDEAGTIDHKWLDRIEEVVSYGINAGLYVILDSHHESWLVPTPEKEDETTKRLCVLWQQIAERFKEYPKELIFEGMNEPRTIGSENEWKGGTKKERDVVNRLNAAFVTTVRNSGGQNTKRWLIITTYGGHDGEESLKSLAIPKNEENIIVAVHAYTPYYFTQAEKGTTEWSMYNKKDTKSIIELMERLDQFFIQKKIPVLLTEFGCKDKNNIEDRVAWTKFYTDEAKKHKIGYIWWDNGKEYILMNRDNYSWRFPEIVEVLIDK